MFTGIVEEKGEITQVNRNRNSLALTIRGPIVTSDVAIGDSIAVNGVCLTVTSFGAEQFTVDVIPETFRASSLADAKVGTLLNLERAMKASDRLGGHFVSGHVDGVGKIERIYREDNAKYIHIGMPKEGLKYITQKGSVAVDGTSLTVFGVEATGFIISLIPETQLATILGSKVEGDPVNIEYDMLAKYLDRLLLAREDERNESTSITIDTLKQNGFM
ncbi:riboflavin synthase [Terrihalobacillus insolitus]|uniref:riboflavin synthase n=1 Tax=Terrihalobacillus insolitus TaxID=2950438 RepID=UPI00233F8F00|nr:riboflavin synthase [Terrihalobacillus insolitus]MDC3413196.1 riboflavin synthase [Terrihalobacillus insolitus]